MADVRPIDYAGLRDIAARVVLSDVRLLSASFASLVHRDALPRGCSLSYSSGLTDYSWKAVSEGAFETLVSYSVMGVAEVRGEREKASRVVLFEMALSWVATYFLRGGTIPTSDSEAMLDFAYANGQLNVFPYHRKQVVDLTTSSGWPALVLPVFVLPNDRPLKRTTKKGATKPKLDGDTGKRRSSKKGIVKSPRTAVKDGGARAAGTK